MRKPNPVTVVRRVRQLAEKYPDAVYVRPDGHGCSNLAGRVKNGPSTPGCIMGQALRGYVRILSRQEHSAIRSFFEEPERLEVRWLQWVQDKQDNGVTWGWAVADADEAFYS